MAAFDHLGSMYDVALKPTLLRTLLQDHVPDEHRPFSNSSELSKVEYMIRTHSLLSESFTERMTTKQVETWKSAVDSWVDHILTLVSNNMPDKCWAGISLLGITCQECSSSRFLTSYSLWFQKLLPYLQSTEKSHLVRVASCASISHIFGRLIAFPDVKRDWSSCAGKVIQPVLDLLNDDKSEAIWEGALHLLFTILTSSPISIHRHYDSVESTIASKLSSGGCSHNILKKLAYCLALLPKVRGDEDSWSVMMEKVVVVINGQLNNAFQGLEEDAKQNEVVRLLSLPGKNSPPHLGGCLLDGEASNKATKRSEQSLMSVVSPLMLCCCIMLTNSYSAKVNVPVCLLLALVERILMVNGSLLQKSLTLMTAKQQENICLELPVLHFHSLELLVAIAKGMGSQLLPHAATFVRIIKMYFKTCAFPELRIKVYSITRILLISMGVGMSLYLAEEVIDNAITDLSSLGNKSGGTLNGLNSNASTKPLVQPSSLWKQNEGLRVEAPNNSLVNPISLRIAALEALEALITVAGSVKSEQWRSKVDNLLIVTAVDSFKEGWVNEEVTMSQTTSLPLPPATFADLQLASLRALLASFLSISQVLPPCLDQGLKLFHKGKQQSGTKLAEFCTHALLALDVLIHPRVLSLSNYSYANHNSPPLKSHCCP